MCSAPYTLRVQLTTHHCRNIFSSVQNKLKLRFTSKMTSLELQRTLEAALDKRTKDTLGPPIGKQLAVFIDDINMPHPDK